MSSSITPDIPAALVEVATPVTIACFPETLRLPSIGGRAPTGPPRRRQRPAGRAIAPAVPPSRAGIIAGGATWRRLTCNGPPKEPAGAVAWGGRNARRRIGARSPDSPLRPEEAMFLQLSVQVPFADSKRACGISPMSVAFLESPADVQILELRECQ